MKLVLVSVHRGGDGGRVLGPLTLFRIPTVLVGTTWYYGTVRVVHVSYWCKFMSELSMKILV